MDDSMSGMIEGKQQQQQIAMIASTDVAVAAAATTATDVDVQYATTTTATISKPLNSMTAAAAATTTTTTAMPTNVPANAMVASSTTPTSSLSASSSSSSAAASSMQNATAKTLKRCLSVPIINTLPGCAGGGANGGGGGGTVSSSAMTTRSAAALAKANLANLTLNRGQSGGAGGGGGGGSGGTVDYQSVMHETPKKHQTPTQPDSSSGNGSSNMANINLAASGFGGCSSAIHIGIPRSNPSSREVSPAPMFNIFAPRARRYSASYSPLGAGTAATGAGGGLTGVGGTLCLTPRVSQLRQEECVDMNSREVNHEREVHSAMQMSQSWEDLTLVAENWSCKSSDELSNPLQVMLPSSVTSCSSPSPTSNRANMRLPYGLSPSPTRRTFATRRSMSPIAMRPSQLGPVKRKFELDDNNVSNWNVYSAPPPKKIFNESRGSSPVCQSPSSVCPSPDSGTYDGRSTPKLFISKLCTSNTNSNNLSSSACSSPMSASPSNSVVSVCPIDSTATSGICSSSSSSSSSSASSVSGGSEPMCIGSSSTTNNNNNNGIDDSGMISMVDADEKPSTSVQAMSTDMQDEATLMDDMKSETSSIGGCSSISVESSSCDSGAKAAAHYFNKLQMADSEMAVGGVSSSTMLSSSAGGGGGGAGSGGVGILGQKNFFINKQGLSGPKKFIVNHDNLPNSCSSGNSSSSNSEILDNSIKISSTTTPMPTTIGVKTRRNAALRHTAASNSAGSSVCAPAVAVAAAASSTTTTTAALAGDNGNAMPVTAMDTLVVENK